MPPTLNYDVYDDDVDRWAIIPRDQRLDTALARIASRRVAWAVAAAWRKHMQLPESHALPAWLQTLLEAQAPD